ncbi:MAG: preprotein translocase subunit YajC [Candidatus Cloacimonas sp. 4484_275]|nr:MAG: preprotein translocase subunit YajC [Candidatus Cloacimonas sp. 4484_275]
MNYILLQAQAATPQPNMLGSLIPFLLMFVILYVLIILPQRKKQKAHQQMLESMKINDRVITSGGIYGKIVNFKKDKNIVVLRIDDTTNTKIEIQRSAIAGIINEEKKGANPTG